MLGDHEAGFFLNPSSGDRQGVLEDLASSLRLVTEGGLPVFTEVGRPQEFMGPLKVTERVPDLIAISRENVGVAQGLNSADTVTAETNARRGVHERFGLLLLGSDWPTLEREPGVEDITPTILAVLDIKPPEWMQGRCLLDAAPARALPNITLGDRADRSPLSREEESAIEDHLRGLGYVE